MSLALLDSRAPAHALYGHHDDGDALQKPNPNGQISTLFSLNFSGLFKEHESENMNSSNANAGPSGLQKSSEINSDIGWNTPGMGSRKPEIGSASGRSKPRMVKLRRHAGSHHTRSSLASETGNIDAGFNPFRPISNNSIPSSSGAEMGSSVSGNLNLGNVGNEAFVFGASPENSNSNLNSKVGKSSGFVENKILDDMRKLKIRSEKRFVNTSNLVSKVNESDRETSSHAEGSKKGVSVSDSVKKKSAIYESAVSILPDEMRKLNNEGSRNVDSSKNANDVRSNLSANDKTHFSFRSDNVTNSFGRSMASELPNELKKLNSKDAGEVDGSSLNYNANDMKKSVVGNINKGSDFLAGSSASILPDKVKNFDIKECVNTYSGEKEEANFSAADKSGFVFGSTGGASGSLDGRAENLLSDKMGKFKIGREGMGTSSWDEKGTPHVELGTTNPKGNIFSGLHKKLEFSARKESAKDARSKKHRGKLKKPTPVAQWLGQGFVLRETTSQEHLDSFESYSPMDVSPYQETLADNKGSRETSVTSEEAFHLDNNNASNEPCPTFSNDATDEDLVVAAQCFDMNECDVKCTETKVEGSQYRFGASVGAEGPSEESFSGAETESFKSSSEQLDSSTGTFVTVANTGVSSSSRIERQDSDDRMQFSSSSVSEDVGGTDFMFAASSSAQGQSSAATRHHKKKNRVKVVHESYSLTQTKVPNTSSTMQFFPISETTSLLSPRRGQKGVLPTLFNRKGDSSEAVKEPETKQEKLSTPAASIGAQEVCEKWRLRGNQAYANGDMSRAEDYYTQGVNCVSQNENSRSCLRALMLCYSNRAATRMSQGRMREALADCMKAAAIDPSFLRVLVRAANCYLALGELEEASLHFMKCLQSGSDVCVDRKLVLEASEGLEKAQKVSECMKQSAELLQRRTSSDAETALSVIAEALTISSYCEKLLQMKGDALFMLRKYEDLIRFCEQTLGSAEMNCSAISADAHLTNLDCSDVKKNLSFWLWRWQLIIKSYFYLGKLEEALDFLKKQEESVSTTEKSASKTLESLIPLAGTIRELIYHKAAGNEAFQLRRHAEAVEHYTAAISCTVESRPFAAVCFYNRAAAYKAMGQIIDAIADCSLAIALDGNYLKAISRQATLFEMIRDYERAAMDLQRLVSLLMKQVEDEANLSSASDRMSSVNELRQSQQRLSVMEEDARKEIPLNMYLILGVDPSVTASEIKKAYRKAALRHHPDKAGQLLARSENGDDGLWKEVVEEVHKDADRLFKMIGEAYAVLSNPTKRSKYDLDEEMRNAQKRGNGGNSSRMPTDVQNYPFERSGSRRQWREVWRSYGNSQSRGSGTTKYS